MPSVYWALTSAAGAATSSAWLRRQHRARCPPSKGLNLGIAAKNNGVYVLGFLARFLETTGSGNVLSTPNLLTLDNEEAKIVIGQNVPFVTGQYTSTGSSNQRQPFPDH